jgi:hypothetical protein
VKSQNTNKVHVMLMENSCRLNKDLCITRGKFDLKGSWVDRESDEQTFVKKDINFIRTYKKVNLF